VDTIQTDISFNPRQLIIQTPLSLLSTIYKNSITNEHKDYEIADALSIINCPQYIASLKVQ